MRKIIAHNSLRCHPFCQALSVYFHDESRSDLPLLLRSPFENVLPSFFKR